MRRRAELDLQTLLESTMWTQAAPLHAGDLRIARGQLDRQLQARLRKTGHSNDRGIIYGGETRIAVRPFVSESVIAIRQARRALSREFVLAKFTSVLEHIAFTLRPKRPDEDLGPSTEKQWQDAWLRTIGGCYPKAIACEAIGLNEHAYDERHRRARKKADGLSLDDAALVEWLRDAIKAEDSMVQGHRCYREYAAATASKHGISLPKAMRLPTLSKATLNALPPELRELDIERVRWRTALSEQPKASKKLWRQLIELREESIVASIATPAIIAWMDENVSVLTSTRS
jgi:hypothetical protein